MARTTKVSRKVRIPNTIDDLLTRDDVNEVLADLEKHRANIKDLIVLYTEKDGKIYSDCTKETMNSTAIYMLESEKNAILNKGNGE